MFRLYKLSIILISFFTLFLLIPEISSSQLIDSVSSEHVVMRMPEGRESLGRDLIPDIERCYIFMNRATNASLPEKSQLL